MSRRPKGARLYWREREGRPGAWVIRDLGVEISTGSQDRRSAEERLAKYISDRNRPDSPSEPTDLKISRALEIYAEQHARTVTDPARIGYAIDALDGFWADLKVSAITRETCKRYGESRTRTFKSGKTIKIKPGTIRRELNVLQAAINYCAEEGYLTSSVKVHMPEAPDPKDRWLTRTEMAWILRGARHLRIDGQHIAKFIIAGRYTGTRKAATLSLGIDRPSVSHGWVDTGSGVLYRKGRDQRSTKKKQTPARLPRQFLMFVRLWQQRGAQWVVEDYRGNRVGDIKNGWKGCLAKAEELAAKAERPIDLTGVTPHVLRHTAITWAMQAGADEWHVSGFFGVSRETLERVYAHHHPDHQGTAVTAMEGRKKRSLRIDSGANLGPRSKRPDQNAT